MFSQEELKNILVLINRATLKGEEAIPTANLQFKIQSLLQPETPKLTEVDEEKKEEVKE